MFRFARFQFNPKSSCPSTIRWCDRCFSTGIKTYSKDEFENEIDAKNESNSPAVVSKFSPSSIFVETQSSNNENNNMGVAVKNLCKKCILIRHDLSTGWTENHNIAACRRFPFVTLPLQFSERIFASEYEQNGVESASMKNTKIIPLTTYEIKTRPHASEKNEDEKISEFQSSSASEKNKSKTKISDLFSSSPGDEGRGNNNAEADDAEEREEEKDKTQEKNDTNHGLADYGFAFPLDLHLSNNEIAQLSSVQFQGPIFWATEEQESLDTFREHVFSRSRFSQDKNDNNNHNNAESDSPVIVGIDTESVPAFFNNKKGNPHHFQRQNNNHNNNGGNSLCLIQIATKSAVFFLRPPTHNRPSKLRNFVIKEIFENPNVLKVGVGLDHDVRDLQKLSGGDGDDDGNDHGCSWRNCKPVNLLDLQSAIKKAHLPRSGLSALSATILGRRVSKTFQLSDWSKQLGKNQIVYAATDAWLCLVLLRRFLHCGLVRPFGEELLVGRQPLLTEKNEENLEDLLHLDEESRKIIKESIAKVVEKTENAACHDDDSEKRRTPNSTRIHVDGEGKIREEPIEGGKNQQDHSSFLMINMIFTSNNNNNDSNVSTTENIFASSPLKDILRLCKTYGLVKEVRRFSLLPTTSNEQKSSSVMILLVHCGSAVVANRISQHLNPMKIDESVGNNSSKKNYKILSSSTILSKDAAEALQRNEHSTDQKSIETYSDGYTRYQIGKKSQSGPSKIVCFPKGTHIFHGNVRAAIQNVVELLKKNGFAVLNRGDDKNRERQETDNEESSVSSSASSARRDEEYFSLSDYVVSSVYEKNKTIFIETQTLAGSINLMMKLNFSGTVQTSDGGKKALVKLLFDDKNCTSHEDIGDDNE